MNDCEEMEIRSRIPEGGWKNIPGVSVRKASGRYHRPKPESRSVLLEVSRALGASAKVEWRSYQRKLNHARPAIELLDVFVDEACKALGESRNAMLGRRRTARLARARHAAMASAREIGLWTVAEVGNAFNRDYTTVIYAVKRANRDPEVRAMVETVLSVAGKHSES